MLTDYELIFLSNFYEYEYILLTSTNLKEAFIKDNDQFFFAEIIVIPSYVATESPKALILTWK